jgi:hypothetical protein
VLKNAHRKGVSKHLEEEAYNKFIKTIKMLPTGETDHHRFEFAVDTILSAPSLFEQKQQLYATLVPIIEHVMSAPVTDQEKIDSLTNLLTTYFQKLPAEAFRLVPDSTVPGKLVVQDQYFWLIGAMVFVVSGETSLSFELKKSRNERFSKALNDSIQNFAKYALSLKIDHAVIYKIMEYIYAC